MNMNAIIAENLPKTDRWHSLVIRRFVRNVTSRRQE